MHRVICAPQVINDIQPYQSQLTGEMIMSRSQHRDHLKDHNMIEVGNETKAIMQRPQPPKDARIKERIVESLYRTGVKKA